MEDFAGDFPGGFFWALFPTKLRRKNPARKSAKKSGGSKIKIREKSVLPKAGPKKGTPKNFCDKDFAELSGELSGPICLKTLVLLGRSLKLLRKFFGTVRAIFWVWGSFLAPE